MESALRDRAPLTAVPQPPFRVVRAQACRQRGLVVQSQAAAAVRPIALPSNAPCVLAPARAARDARRIWRYGTGSARRSDIRTQLRADPAVRPRSWSAAA